MVAILRVRRQTTAWSLNGRCLQAPPEPRFSKQSKFTDRAVRCPRQASAKGLRYDGWTLNVRDRGLKLRLLGSAKGRQCMTKLLPRGVTLGLQAAMTVPTANQPDSIADRGGGQCLHHLGVVVHVIPPLLLLLPSSGPVFFQMLVCNILVSSSLFPLSCFQHHRPVSNIFVVHF